MVAKPQQQSFTPAREWRKGREEGVTFHFPSGFEAIVRPVNVDTFIVIGNVPDVLSAIVSQMISGNAASLIETQENQQKMYDIYNAFCKASFIKPRVVDTAADITDTDNEICLEDISDTDKQTLFQFIGAPASLLAQFRPLSQDTVDDLVGQPSQPPSAK